MHQFIRGILTSVTGLGVAIAILIAVDYGIGPAQAASMEGPLAALPESPTPEPDSTISDGGAFASGAADSADRAVGPDPGRGFIRLPGHVIDALAKATVENASGRLAASTKRARQDLLTLTLTLKRDDQFGFDRYLNDVYDPQSKNFRHFLTQKQITQRFGPSKQGYSQVLAYMHHHGLRLVEGSKNRLTMTVRGSRAKIERAFALNIRDYRINDTPFSRTTMTPHCLSQSRREWQIYQDFRTWPNRNA